MAITLNPFFIITALIVISHSISTNKFSYRPPNSAFSFEQPDILCLGGATGPESFAFGVSAGEGPYTGVSDGRILKWVENQQRWVNFAVTSSHRVGCEAACNTYEMEPICGRPLGLAVNESNGDLYIADAYMGLMKVGCEGGLATKMATSGDGIPFMFLNGLDIDQSTGTIYFTDSSSLYQRRDYMSMMLNEDKTGRLMKYDVESKKVEVLVKNLTFANGVAISKDGNSILVAETTTSRILKYWIKTPKNGSLEIFSKLPGFPDNIKKSPRGGYWVGVNSKRENGEYSGMALRVGEDGGILEFFDDQNGFKSLSEANERDRKLWIGSLDFPFVPRYNI